MRSSFMNSLKISLFLAYKSIRKGNVGATILTITIMTLAFINIVLVYSLLDGVIARTNSNVIDFQYGHAVIDPESEEIYIDNAGALVRKIEAMPEVTGVSRHYKEGATVSYKDKYASQTVYSIRPAEEEMVTKVHNFIVEGSYLDSHDPDSILLGNEISGGYNAKFEKTSLQGVQAGDKVNVTYNNGFSKLYTVKGIFSTQDVATDMRAYVTEEELESVLGVNDKASEIIITLERVGIENSFVNKLLSLGIKEKIDTWKERAGLSVSLVDSFTIIKTLIGGISLIVAAATIFIIIYINTVNRRRQIGILKAIGIKENVIIKSFLFQALFYTGVGCILGYLLMISVIEPYFMLRPLRFPMGQVFLDITSLTLLKAFISLIGAAFIAGIIPSYKAAKENILKSIWG
ncbi:MAG: FtsX-like permease family protein [Nanoarchaeota archaeon]|nr:FtsX-like permease family protein [Nanoarchaeota archaeon]